jgi:hypothetical protein
MSFLIPVSTGELVDKITILEIKTERMICTIKKMNVAAELKQLRIILEKINTIPIEKEMKELKEVNEKLWDIENAKRKHETLQLFDDNFIRLARDVYIYNDKRATIKHKINDITNSVIVEEKEHITAL